MLQEMIGDLCDGPTPSISYICGVREIILTLPKRCNRGGRLPGPARRDANKVSVFAAEIANQQLALKALAQVVHKREETLCQPEKRGNPG